MCVMIMSTCIFGISAFAVVEDGITYTAMPDGATLTISSVKDSVSGIVKIPSEVDGMKVVKINDNAFKNKSSILSIEIPSTVQSVGTNAFYNCIGLMNVRFDASESAVTLGSNAFGKCTALEKIILPTEIKSIPSGCFSGCSSLNGVLLPSTVTSIGSEAFLSCSSLTTFYIPASVTSIGSKAFVNCNSIEKFMVADENTKFRGYDSCLYSADASELIQYPLANSRTDYTIKSTVKTIDEYAFANSVLSSVTLPAGLKTIGDYAFSDCKKLSSITIPGSVEAFNNAFEGSGLVTATVQSGVKAIPEYSFSYCSSLKSVTLSSGLESIDLCAFYNCTSLESVIIPAGTTTVESAAFSGCTSLKKVHMPESLKDIASNAFSGSSNVVICSYSDKFYSKTFASDNGISFVTCTGDEVPYSQIKIKNNSGSRSINYGYTLHLSVDPETVADGCTVVWEVKGNGYSASSSGNNCNIKCTGSGTADVTAKLVFNGNVISQANEKVTCNTNFFLKIAAFFKNLFKSNMDIYQ